MSLNHWAVLSPLIKVRVKATFLNGELYPATSTFRHRYAFTLSMKSLALVLSPRKICGSAPIVFTSVAGWMGCWGRAGFSWLGLPGPPGPPGPVGPFGPPLCLLRFCCSWSHRCWGVVLLLLELLGAGWELVMAVLA